MLRSCLLILLIVGTGYGQEKSCVAVLTVNGSGSGTVVAKDGDTCYVLTNRHVADGSKKIWVIYDRKRYDGSFVKSHGSSDLALVSVKIDATPVELADAEPKEGDYVKHYGKATQFQEGKMSGWTQFQSADGTVMNSDIFSVPGDSGSGMFNKDGRLIGVHYGRKGDPDSVTVAIAVRLTTVKEFVKPYVKK